MSHYLYMNIVRLKKKELLRGTWKYSKRQFAQNNEEIFWRDIPKVPLEIVWICKTELGAWIFLLLTLLTLSGKVFTSVGSTLHMRLHATHTRDCNKLAVSE